MFTVNSAGTKIWRNSDGERHRLDGPAVEYTDGSTEWYKEGKLHRLDGPARELANGTKAWYVEGQYHRLEGPAYEGAYGYKEWYVDGVKVAEKDYPQAVLLYKCRMVLDS